MTGTEYLKAIQASQDSCQAATQERLGTIDSKLPDTLEALGETLLLLRQYGSCNWGCRGGAHLMERFSARAVSYAVASLRLMWIGHYDEAYVLIRNLGELANLLFLFASDAKQLEAWRAAGEAERRNGFGAGTVRQRLSERQLPIVLKRDLFNELSSRFAHTGQLPVVQLHNPDGAMSMGGRIQPVGLSFGMAQVVVFTSTIALALTELGDLPDSKGAALRAADSRMTTAIGIGA